MVASVILSVAGLAISVWWFVWYYAPVLPTPCGAGSPAGVTYNCPKFTIAVHWTVLGRPNCRHSASPTSSQCQSSRCRQFGRRLGGGFTSCDSE